MNDDLFLFLLPFKSRLVPARGLVVKVVATLLWELLLIITFFALINASYAVSESAREIISWKDFMSQPVLARSGPPNPSPRNPPRSFTRARRREFSSISPWMMARECA